MTSRLSILRAQLAGLSRARSRVRAATAWSGTAIALLAVLAAFFLLDLVFELAVPQRLVVLLGAAAAVGWAFWRFTRPLLGIREDEIEMALLVERQQRIGSDLVAALQFEQPEARHWGSPQLSTAVVEYVAAVGRGIDVFEGFSKDQMNRRLGILAASLAAMLLFAAVSPGHVAALANRLLLGARHYPTRTRIEQVVLNRGTVLLQKSEGTAPRDSKQPQGRPLTFLVQCSGDLPASGAIQLAAAGRVGSRTRLALKPLSLEERRARLEEAAQKLSERAQAGNAEVPPPWRDEVRALLQFDAPQAIPPLNSAKTDDQLAPVLSAVTTTLARWPAEAGRTTILSGELARLNESLHYKLLAGDAWTDSAAIQMIPLPIVELKITPTPPRYARGAVEKPDPSGRQLAVLEGSSVELAIACTNRKRLQKAWLTLQGRGAAQQIDLSRDDAAGLAWSARGAAALKRVREELRYEIQVLDEDGLSLETPIRGTIRIRPDRPPSGAIAIVHRVVLPTAAPVVEYKATDDYGIARLVLSLDIERGGAKQPAQTPAPNTGTETATDTTPPPAALVPTETHNFDITASNQRPGDASSAGTLLGSYPLSLSPLKLVKGDRLKLTLEVTDDRGENEQGQPAGTTYQSDPLLMEISDEAGVLAAIGEADPRSEERLTEIIKRQLGIGEGP